MESPAIPSHQRLDHSGFIPEDENLTIWSDNETALFLSIWRRSDVQTALRQYTRKRPIWKKVSSELAGEGYRRNAEQCKSKMHNLMTSYRRVKKGLDSESRCKFFPVIDEVMTSVEFERPAAAAVPVVESTQSSAPTAAPPEQDPDPDADGSEGSGPGNSAGSDGTGSHASPRSASLIGIPWRMSGVRPHVDGVISGRSHHASGDDVLQPPRKRYCRWESQHSDGPAAQPIVALDLGPSVYERPPSPEPRATDCGARDLRVCSRTPPPAQQHGAVLPAVYGTMETHRMLAERARHLLSIMPASQVALSAMENRDGAPRSQHAILQPDPEPVETVRASAAGDSRTMPYLERMETLLQELVDMQRAFLISEERRRREQLMREENWRMQDKEFLLRLAQTLTNSHQ